MDRVDWIPVDILADIIIELAGVVDTQSLEPVISTVNVMETKAGVAHSQEASSLLPVYHAVNPQATNWAQLGPIVAKNLGEAINIVSWSEWLEALRRSQQVATVGDLKMNPGLKLLDFFESLEQAEEQRGQMSVLETRKSRVNSRTLSSLQSVNAGWMNMWLRQWGF